MGSSSLGKAASLASLLSECIQAFDDDGELQGNLLPRTLLLMHRWYVSSSELAGKLLHMYRVCSGPGCQETRLKICYLIRYWIVSFPAEFNLDLGLIRITEEFRDLAAQLGSEEHLKLIDISTIPSFDWMRKVTQRKKQVKKGKASLLFDHLDSLELAQHLTFLEFKSMRRISFPDYQSYVIHGRLQENPALERSIALFNGVSQWVQLMVLSKLTPQTRAQVVTKFIHVAQNLLQLQNFNTLTAVVGGLSHSAIARLKDTQAHLTPQVLRMWSEMTELVSSSNNYSCYRKSFSESRGFRLPVLGVHLKDLIALHVVFPDRVESGGKVNLVKMQQLYATFNELVWLQSAAAAAAAAAAQLEPDMDLVHLLTLSLDLYYSEEEIHQLSLLREPRGGNKTLPSSPSAPAKALVPLDWASSVATKPDPSVVNKHIRKVVDSVFRNYDPDRDGFISQQDFESVAANFPFLDSFCVLDKDRDGLISKDELTSYFLRANALPGRTGPTRPTGPTGPTGPGFIHSFQETNFLRPSFCEHCAGFLWGIIKQGYKCKDCGVNCHKQCRVLLVLACRKRVRSGSVGGRSPRPAPPTCAGEDEVDPSIALVTGSASRATRTEPPWAGHGWGAQGGGLGGAHTFPKTKRRTHRKTSKNKGPACCENQNGRQQPVVSARCSLESHVQNATSLRGKVN